jgi:ribonuclease PH
VQGTAEGKAFGRKDLDAMLDLALEGCATLRQLQLAALE